MDKAAGDGLHAKEQSMLPTSALKSKQEIFPGDRLGTREPSMAPSSSQVSKHEVSPADKRLEDKIANNNVRRGRPSHIPFKEIDHRRKSVINSIALRKAITPNPLLQKADEKKVAIERQLEDTQKKLRELISLGSELMSNIKVANEKREILRTQNELERRENLRKDLQKESIESLANFNDISSKWSELKTLKEPIVLFEKIEEQKRRIMNIMEQKDDIIKQCQEEINRLNDVYHLEQEKQSNDIYCLVERIDNQIELLKVAHKEHLQLLETTIEEERRNIELEATNKWNSLYDEMLDKQNQNFEIVKEKEHFYSEELIRICTEQDEITRASRIRLEKDAETLQWELLNTKNVVLMTSEKLDYNYQVLQKRNEENVIINNQQKRRVSRLNESISTLKKKIRDAGIKTEINISKLTSNIHKLHMGITDLEKKAEHFRRSNQDKYNRICCINIREIEKVLAKVFEIDSILHEQQLAIPWERPDVSFDCEEPMRTTPTKTPEKQRSPAYKANESHMDKVTYSRLLRNILRRISDRTGFLVEEKLLNILSPFKEDEKFIVRLDNIFTALRINDSKDISRLITFFIPYCWCPNCSNNVLPEALQTLFTIGNKFNPTSLRATLSTEQLLSNAIENLSKTSINCDNHYLVIEPALVLTALKQFTKEHSMSKKVNLQQQKEQKTVKEVRSRDEIRNVLTKLGSCVPESKEKLWLSLEHGLTHFLEVLKQREQLDNDCKFLRKQNQELSHIFQKFHL